MKPNRSEPARASDPDVLAASGQIDAKLLRRYEGALRDFFGRRVYSRDEVDDLVQEAFARLIESGGRRDVEYPAAYLFRIASNLIHDRGRRRARSPTRTTTAARPRATTRRLSTTASSRSSSTVSRPASTSASRVVTSRRLRTGRSAVTPVRRARRSTVPTRVRRPLRPGSLRSVSRSSRPASRRPRSSRPARHLRPLSR